MKRLPYKEGDWFALPLENGGYGVGLIARAPKRGKILLGYFFGPRRDEVPALSDVAGLSPQDALLVGRFGDLFLIQGRWPILGAVEGWDRSRWPIPVFGSVEEGGGAWRVEYPDADPSAEPRLAEVSRREARRLPEDRLMGAGAVELMLDDELSGSSG